MIRQIHIIVLILGLIITTNCQENNTTNGNNTSGSGTGTGSNASGGAQGSGSGSGRPSNTTTNHTTPSTTDQGQAELSLSWQNRYLHVLSDSGTPSLVAEGLQPFLDEYVDQVLNLNTLAVMMANKEDTMDTVEDYQNLTDTWNEIEDYETGVYSIITGWLETIEYSVGKVKCYYRFNYLDFQAYAGIKLLTTYFFNNQSSQDSDLLDEFQIYCTDYDKTERRLNDLLNIMLGQDPDCDLLRDMFNGVPAIQIWQDWKDQIANTFGYILLDILWAQMSISACQELEGATIDPALSVQMDYSVQIESLIQRYTQLQQMAKTNEPASISANLKAYLGMFDGLEGLSTQVAAINANYVLPYLYQEYDWLIFVFSNNTSTDSYSISCRQCVQVLQQAGVNLVAAWIPKNSTPSFTQSTFDDIRQSGTPQQIVDDVYTTTNCISGVIAISQQADQYLISQLDDRYEIVMTPELNVYVWGTDEDCSGQP